MFSMKILMEDVSQRLDYGVDDDLLFYDLKPAEREPPSPPTWGYVVEGHGRHVDEYWLESRTEAECMAFDDIIHQLPHQHDIRKRR